MYVNGCTCMFICMYAVGSSANLLDDDEKGQTNSSLGLGSELMFLLLRSSIIL